MFARCRRLALSAAVGLSIASGLLAQEPLRFTGDVQPAAHTSTLVNQRLADSVALALRADGRLRHYSVDVTLADGVAELTGSVSSADQRAIALEVAQTVPGVVRVVDRLVTNSGVDRIAQVQALEAPAAEAPAPGPKPMSVPTPGAPSMGAMGAVPPGAPGMNEPQPIFQAPMGGGAGFDCTPPKMPPYAWPTYAPYNNYSRVAYPTYYPYNAWPFIGPVYPFPKVPLGWRSVKLEWEDGHWWFSKTATPHDWWRIRYY